MFRIAAVAAFAAFAPVAADAAIFTENFDNPSIGKNWDVFETFGQFVTTGGAGIEIQRSGTVVDAHSGDQYVELDSDEQVTPRDPSYGSNSSMAALLNLTVGQQYKVSFAYRPRTNNVNDNGIKISIGSLVGNAFTETQEIGDVDARRSEQNAWNVVTLIFTALAGDNAIQFAAYGNENELGGFLDSIEVYETPLPAGGILIGTGLAAFFGTRGRKKTRA